MHEHTLAAYAFWRCADPAEALDALAWRHRRHEGAREFAFIAQTAQAVTVGKASRETLRQLPTKWARYAPPEARPALVLTFADTHAGELVRYIRELFAPHALGGSWYSRAAVEPWIALVLAHEPPAYAPALPCFEPEDRWRPPANAYQARLQRAEALATYRDLLMAPECSWCGRDHAGGPENCRP